MCILNVIYDPPRFHKVRFLRRASAVALRIILVPFLRTALNKLIAPASVRVTATRAGKRVYTRDSSEQRGRFLSVTRQPVPPPSVARNILTSLSPWEESAISLGAAVTPCARTSMCACVHLCARSNHKSARLPRGILRGSHRRYNNRNISERGAVSLRYGNDDTGPPVRPCEGLREPPEGEGDGTPGDCWMRPSKWVPPRWRCNNGEI